MLGVIGNPGRLGGRLHFTLTRWHPHLKQAEAWRGMGASHFSVNTMSAGLATPDGQINAIREFKEVVNG